MSNKTWVDILVNFKASYTFRPVAIAEEVVRSQVQATLNSRIDAAQVALLRDLRFFERIVSGNEMVSALATNFYLRYSPPKTAAQNSPRMSPRIFDNCSCLNVEGCPHPATFNDSYGHSISMPGIIADCLIVDGALASTLECYYSQTCLSLLHPLLPLDIKPLSNDLNKHFTVNTTIQKLLNELMIDEMTSEIRFDLLYSQCNPTYCAYSYTHRFDILFVITTIIGIIGALSFVLKLIAPYIATIILRWRSRGALNNNMSLVTPPLRIKCKLNFIFEIKYFKLLS
jgi:hypothetical protein